MRPGFEVEKPTERGCQFSAGVPGSLQFVHGLGVVVAFACATGQCEADGVFAVDGRDHGVGRGGVVEAEIAAGPGRLEELPPWRGGVVLRLLQSRGFPTQQGGWPRAHQVNCVLE